MNRGTEARLQKLETSRRKSRVEDMTDQEIGERIETIIEQLGGREKLLVELETRTCEEPNLLRLITLVRQWKPLV